MQNREDQKREIEKLRAELHRLALDRRQTLSDPEVVSLSRRLDKLIVEYQRLMDQEPAIGMIGRQV